jgi:hypothetical protein
LWRIALADVAALDRFEGLGDGLFVKATQPVVVTGGAKRAMVYFGTNDGPGVAEADYIADVLDAARRWNLSGAAIAQLQRFAAEAGVAVPSRNTPTSAHKSVRPRFATPFDRA